MPGARSRASSASRLEPRLLYLPDWWTHRLAGSDRPRGRRPGAVPEDPSEGPGDRARLPRSSSGSHSGGATPAPRAPGRGSGAASGRFRKEVEAMRKRGRQKQAE